MDEGQKELGNFGSRVPVVRIETLDVLGGVQEFAAVVKMGKMWRHNPYKAEACFVEVVPGGTDWKEWTEAELALE